MDNKDLEADVEVQIVAAAAVDTVWRHTKLNEVGEVWIEQAKAIAGVKAIVEAAIRSQRHDMVEIAQARANEFAKRRDVKDGTNLYGKGWADGLEGLVEILRKEGSDGTLA